MKRRKLNNFIKLLIELKKNAYNLITCMHACMDAWMHALMQSCSHAKFWFTLSFMMAAVLVIGCGDKFDIGQLAASQGNANIAGDTLYIQLNPPWNGFNQPEDMIVGREPFIYVADTYNDRIVMMNLNGSILGTRQIRRPVALAQDYKLNLIVCAQLDTVVNGITQTYGALYKIDLVTAEHHIDEAPITRLLPRVMDFKYPDRRYTGIAVFYNNIFYVARTGPANTSFVDPDNSILYFVPRELFGGGEGDTLIGRVPNIDPISSGLVSANQISSLTSFNKKSIDFIETLTGNNSLKTQWLHYVQTQVSEGYVAQLTPSDGGDLMTPNKFSQPEGSCIDNSGNIFIADAGKDSVFKFTPLGDELQSFGGPAVFNHPYAVAFFDKTLYVVDRDNNRILRFILSTDLR